ncbi:HD domain-containing protein [Candidatus Nanohalovita haloferacivicina]|uniref:HD domain-containing protein n=1 Tax=Candidatus Nanohalovita haloferacivicina TaxID=2978046 RepID=UPI00325FAB14|nr:HD superfamily phosphohydrolase [Candidatus Nanohalobia archaeon BNXNv]
MKVDDRVYGEKEIKEEVIIDLINSKPVQRLKKVHQAGPQPFYMDKKPMTRYEHSIGVFLLLRDHGASIEEQIAGLLHDVPHTAFSHTADFVFDTDDHEYHDRFLEKVVKDSEIPEILEKHGLDLEYILDEENFGLLERDAPDLCADRIDYFLRDSKSYGDWKVEQFVESLTVEDGMFVLDDPDIAVEFAEKYAEADEEWWANPKEVVIIKMFAQALSEAIDTGIMNEEDLFGTDDEVLEKLRESDNQEIKDKLETLKNGFEIETEVEDPDMTVTTKARSVNPPVLHKGKLKRSTDFSEKLKQKIDEHMEYVGSGYQVKIIEK